ncbi:NUDIX hydrolase [Simkania negevensis]|uniref:NUDIX hydrolase n=1 Tax=Simkania negevensis TaxID=83561 RepID=A0ABS3AQD1_9BACT|nr:NUDIX hydrolase [Simkania negevensis]
MHNIKIEPAITLVEGLGQISKEQQNAADEVWQHALQTKSQLRDNPILCITKREETALHVSWLPYRLYYAQFFLEKGCFPTLFALCVTGIVRKSKKVLLGKRSNRVTQYPGCWECIPAGGIESAALDEEGSISPQTQLLKEFEEETGLNRDAIKQMRFASLLRDSEARCIDLCYNIFLETELSPIPSEEHTEVEWFDLTALPSAALPSIPSLKELTTTIF